MIEGDEAHLFREWEVEKEDTTMRAITSLIVDVPIRTYVPPGMSAVYFGKPLIHIRHERHKKDDFILATKRRRRHKIII